MDLKKSLQADLQNKRLVFFEAGMAFALLAVIGAFIWNKAEIEEIVFDPAQGHGGAISEIIPVTKEPLQGNTMPQQKVQPSVDFFEIVKSETEILEEINFNEFTTDAIFADANVGPFGIEGAPNGGEGLFSGDEVFNVVEEMPKFMGKDPSAFITWVLGKVEYPRTAIERNIQGRVMVSYIVEKDGTLSNIEAMPGADPILAEAAIRAVKASPKWTPGKQGRKPARVKMTIPVLFKIN